MILSQELSMPPGLVWPRWKVNVPLARPGPSPQVGTLIIFAAALGTFFYWDSPVLRLVRQMVDRLEGFFYYLLVALSGTPGAGGAHLVQLAASVAVAAVAAWLAAAARYTDRQRLAAAALALFCAVLLIGSGERGAAFWHAAGLLSGWLTANVVLGRRAVYLNLAVAYVWCSCIARDFAEPTGEGFRHAVAFARSWGVEFLGWPLGVGILMVIGYLVSWTAGRAFGAARVDRFIP
ncbi:hypothetical protein ISF26_03000 [Gloeobacter morelensis MG652769]|uniref:Uncharacterized protein n=2 Tax=Gloeobacter TaxID=33071 RepID=A0ABY3PNP4_9CYAN|nr:hypothetical protein ISF26_03000 [Gloeobacter morelensis MG652769]